MDPLQLNGSMEAEDQPFHAARLGTFLIWHRSLEARRVLLTLYIFLFYRLTLSISLRIGVSSHYQLFVDVHKRYWTQTSGWYEIIVIFIIVVTASVGLLDLGCFVHTHHV